MSYLVGFAKEVQGFRPTTHPGGALAGLARRVRGMGDAAICLDENENSIPCSDPGCKFGDCGSSGLQLTSGSLCLDQNENQIPCGAPDCRYGDCLPASAPGQTPATMAVGAPTGSLLLYQATFQTSVTLNVNTIISQVANAIRQYGLQVVQSQTTGGALTVGNFNVAFTLQVTGSGFAAPPDAGSIVDHAYYTATGHLPVISSTVLQSAPGSAVPSLVPGAPAPPAAAAASTSLTGWFEQNAWWLGLLAIGAVALPAILNRK